MSVVVALECSHGRCRAAPVVPACLSDRAVVAADDCLGQRPDALDHDRLGVHCQRCSWKAWSCATSRRVLQAGCSEHDCRSPPMTGPAPSWRSGGIGSVCADSRRMRRACRSTGVAAARWSREGRKTSQVFATDVHQLCAIDITPIRETPEEASDIAMPFEAVARSLTAARLRQYASAGTAKRACWRSTTTPTRERATRRARRGRRARSTGCGQRLEDHPSDLRVERTTICRSATNRRGREDHYDE